MLNYSDAIFPSASFANNCVAEDLQSCAFTDDFHVCFFFAQILAGRSPIRVRTLSDWGSGFEDNDTNTVYGALTSQSTKTTLVFWQLTEERLKAFDFPIVYDVARLGLVAGKERGEEDTVLSLFLGIFAPFSAGNWMLGGMFWFLLTLFEVRFPQGRILLMAAVLRFFTCELYKSHMAAIFIHPNQNSLSFDSFDQLADLVHRGEKRIVLRFSNSSHISQILRNGNGTEWETLSELLKTHPPVHIPVTVKEICKFLVRNPSYILVDSVDDIRQKCRTECLEIPRWAQNQLPVSFRGFVMPKNHSLLEFAAQNAEAVIGYRATFLAFHHKNLQACPVPEETDGLHKHNLFLGGLIFAFIAYTFTVFVFAVECLSKKNILF